jgi:hypothetical protein
MQWTPTSGSDLIHHVQPEKLERPAQSRHSKEGLPLA